MHLDSLRMRSSSALRRPCDARGRGGFEKLRTHGQTDPIEFEVYYKEQENAQLVGYKIAIETRRERVSLCIGRRYGIVQGQTFFLGLSGRSGLCVE